LSGLKSLEEELKGWQGTEAETVKVSTIKAHPALQPRSEKATRFLDRPHTKRQSDDHVIALRMALEADAPKDLVAILVARVDRSLYVVDGHHRLQATKSAGRLTMKAHIKAMSLNHAVQLSRIVNVQNRSLPLTRGQKSEIIWQYLIELTQGGKRSLMEAGTSERKVSKTFTIASKTTVNNMMNQLAFAATLKASGELDEDERDGHTGWPTWTTVNYRLSPAFGLEQSGKLDRKVAELAAKFAVLLDLHGADAVKAWRLACLDRKVDGELAEESEHEF
jgi:hypothetical protein